MATKRTRPAILRRFPSFRRWRDPESGPPVPPAKQAAYPELADDFQLLDEELVPTFVQLDRLALREQNRHRRQQVILIVGAFLATIFAAVQATLEGQAWPGVVTGLLALAISGFTTVVRQRGSQRTFLDARVKAERLRGLYFAYLAGVGDFGGDPDGRRSALTAGVAAVKHGREPQ